MASIGGGGRGRGGNRTPASRTVRSTTRDDNSEVHTYETTNTSTFRPNGNDNESSFPGTEFGSFPDFPQGGFGEFGSFPDMPPMPPMPSMPTFHFTQMDDLMAQFGGPEGFGAFGLFDDESDDMTVPRGGSGASLSHQSQPAQGKHHEDKTMDDNTKSDSATTSDVAEGTRSSNLSPEREAKSSEQGSASVTATTQASKSGHSLQPTVEDDPEDWEVV
ncbi:hypothetical protein I204_02275 [Kwoniella mangroviensis CBS 8886]|nr:hypothetical protein I204_02275 [Kwoniella mangroviensis CBS 8886]